jgi:hypothetical protein
MKLTKNLITREAAVVASPDYVAFVEGDFEKFKIVDSVFNGLKRNQKVITYVLGQFVLAKVSSVVRDDDGPVVRVTNEEFSWRVDGSGYAFPIK